MKENAYLYRTSLYLVSSASAEFFADIGLAPFEAVKVRVQTKPGFATTFRENTWCRSHETSATRANNCLSLSLLVILPVFSALLSVTQVIIRHMRINQFLNTKFTI